MNKNDKEHIEHLRKMQKDPSLVQTYAKLNIPPPPLNGGLYTGEPFKEELGHGNVPIIPDTGFMTHFALRTAHPPEEALYQYSAGIRPGNNTPIMPGVDRYSEGKYGLFCQNAPRKHTKLCPCIKCRGTKYYYL